MNELKHTKLAIIAPCYNEEINIDIFYSAVIDVIKRMQFEINPKLKYEFIFIDDGSLDNTSNSIKQLKQKDDNVKLIKFSRNFGKEAAILAGFKMAINSDCVVLMDVDLQDPPCLIFDMYKNYLKGYKMVYAKRNSRGGGWLFKIKI